MIAVFNLWKFVIIKALVYDWLCVIKKDNPGLSVKAPIDILCSDCNHCGVNTFGAFL